MSENKDGYLEEGQLPQQSPAAQRASDEQSPAAQRTPEILSLTRTQGTEYQPGYVVTSRAESVFSVNSFQTNLSNVEPGQQDSPR